METTIKGLTFEQYKEYQNLRKLIFNNTNVVLYNDNLMQSVEVLRYNELNKIKLNYFRNKLKIK